MKFVIGLLIGGTLGFLLSSILSAGVIANLRDALDRYRDYIRELIEQDGKGEGK